MADAVALEATAIGVWVRVPSPLPKERKTNMPTIKTMTPKEWLDLLPCKIYDKSKNESYLIVGIAKEGLWYYDTITLYDEDSFFGDGSYEVDCPRLLRYNDLHNEFELGIEPTEKQIQWLEDRKLMTESMTKQEAWKIINDAIKSKKYYQDYSYNSYVGRVLDSMLNPYDIIGQCGASPDDDYWEDEDLF